MIVSRDRKLKENTVKIAVGALVAVIALGPALEARAEEPEQTVSGDCVVINGEYDYKEYSEMQKIKLSLTTPCLEYEYKTYFKDGKPHKAVTLESEVEMCEWVCSLRLDGKEFFRDVDPSILVAQQSVESDFIIDATNGLNGSGSCVGLSQSSCYYNVENVNKWAYMVGIEENVTTKERAREILLEYPIVNTLVQAEQLQYYMDNCPRGVKDKEAYALRAYRYGPSGAGSDPCYYVGNVRNRCLELEGEKGYD